MKRYLKILLYTIVLSLSVFAFSNIDASAKTKFMNVDIFSISRNVLNTIDETNKEIERLEQERLEQERKEQERLEQERLEQERIKKEKEAKAREEAAKKNNSTKKVKYGTYGRLYVSSYSAALYDYNVHTNSGSSLQTLVNNVDSAAYYKNKGKLVIADHSYQGFSVLANLNEGTSSYIKFENGSTIRYKLIKKSRGYNTGPDLIDTDGNSFFNMGSDLIMYTCCDDGIIVTLWVLA